MRCGRTNRPAALEAVRRLLPRAVLRLRGRSRRAAAPSAVSTRRVSRSDPPNGSPRAARSSVPAEAAARIRLGSRGECDAVLAARRRQRVRRLDGRYRARRAAARRSARVRARVRNGGAVLHRHVRLHEGAGEPLRRPDGRPHRPQTAARSPAGSSRSRFRLLLMYAPAWGWIVFANVLLGINQGLCWSMTVVMKIDLVGPKQRGLAMGLNEFAGYLAVGVAAYLSGAIAAVVRAAAVAVRARHRVGRRRARAFRVRRARDARARAVRGRARRRERVARRRRRSARSSRASRGRTARSRPSARRGSSTISTTGSRGDLLPLHFAAAGLADRAHRHPRGGVSGDMGPVPARDRSAVRPRRPKVDDRGRHVAAGGSRSRCSWRRRTSASGSPARCCSASARRWSIRRCSPRSATSSTRSCARRPSASTVCGATPATRSARCFRASSHTRSDKTPRSRSSRRSRSPPAPSSRSACARRIPAPSALTARSTIMIFRQILRAEHRLRVVRLRLRRPRPRRGRRSSVRGRSIPRHRRTLRHADRSRHLDARPCRSSLRRPRARRANRRHAVSPRVRRRRVSVHAARGRRRSLARKRRHPGACTPRDTRRRACRC